MKDLAKAKERLLSDGSTCVLCKGEKIISSALRGVKPLVVWLTEGADLKGYSAADKVVGKATAFLYVLLGVKAVYAHVISQSALQVLTNHNIKVEYSTLTENIINRRGDGICPFESAVLNIDDPATAYDTIRRKMGEMNILI